jgi:hypothetical protein
MSSTTITTGTNGTVVTPPNPTSTFMKWRHNFSLKFLWFREYEMEISIILPLLKVKFRMVNNVALTQKHKGETTL